jgi:lipid A 4'-phosphatase
LKIDSETVDEASCAAEDESGMRRVFIIFLVASACVGAIFFFAPVIDLWASAQFYQEHRGFIISNPSSASALPFLPWLAKGFVSACCLIIAVNAARRYFLGTKMPLVASNRVIVFLLFALAIGPGLFVNAVLKEHWGRARPFQVTEFGGSRRFTAAFVVSDQCKTNCSFVSGDASLGFFGLSFFFIARRRRAFIAGAGILAGSIFGLVRMAQGAHFLSDVIFSGVFTFLAAWLLYFLFLRHWPIRQVTPNAT